MIKLLSHFGHAVKSLEAALAMYTDLFNLRAVEKENLKEDEVLTALCSIGNQFVEPLQPSNPQSVLAKYIDRWGEGIYHLSMVVDDIERAVAELESKGARVTVKRASSDIPTKRVWLDPRALHGLLVELIPEELLKNIRGKSSHPKIGETEMIKLSHVHHVVRSIDSALEAYDKLLGLRPYIRMTTPGQGVNNALVPIGDNYIEVLEPTDPQGLAARFLERRGEGLRSVCFVVKELGDIEAVSRHLESKGIEFLRHSMHLTLDIPGLWLRRKHTMGLMTEICPYIVTNWFYNR